MNPSSFFRWLINSRFGSDPVRAQIMELHWYSDQVKSRLDTINYLKSRPHYYINDRIRHNVINAEGSLIETLAILNERLDELARELGLNPYS